MTQDTYLTIANMALADAATRSKITDLPAPFGGGTDTSTEAYYVGLYFADVRDHLLRAARWNFAKRVNQLFLWKATPGAPENPTVLAGRVNWVVAYPAPPWQYSYLYPSDNLYTHRLLGPSPWSTVSPPIFSGVTNLLTSFPRTPYGKFEVASDSYDAFGNSIAGTYTLSAAPAIAATGVNYLPGDIISLVNSQFPVTMIGPGGAPQAVSMIVTGINASGGITSVLVGSPGSYASAPSNPVAVAATTGNGSGATFTCSFVLNSTLPTNQPGQNKQKVILSNIQGAIAEYTRNDTIPADWDSEFVAAFTTALAGRIVLQLTGDKALARDKLSIANNYILEARVADANESLTIQDHIPDWLRVRGVGGGLGFDDAFLAPFGPLFPLPAIY